MDITTMVSGILATQDETRQLQIATAVLNANTRKEAAQILLAQQASPASLGPGIGDNLDITT